MDAAVDLDALTFEALRARAEAMAGEIFCAEGAMDPAALKFLAQVHATAVADDFAQMGLDDLVFACADLWAWAQQPDARDTRVRVVSGRRADGTSLGRDILEVVTRDKPFLVDSVMGEVNDQGVRVDAMFHPIVSLADARGGVDDGGDRRTSLIHVQIEPLTDARRDALASGVRDTLADVNAAVADFAAMRARMDHVINELATAPVAVSDDERQEAIAFLRWLRGDHFAFLGVRDYEFPTDEAGVFLPDEPVDIADSNLGILRDMTRNVLRRTAEPAILSPQVQEMLLQPEPLIVAKATLRSRVHRRTDMNYVGVKRYRADGRVVGETRFVGLFTAEAYHALTQDIPLIRSKVRRVLSRSGFAPNSHSYKRLRSILERYPRDELFESADDDLLTIGLGLAHAHDRPRTRLFVRPDPYDRYVSAFVAIPRERFNSRVREHVGDALARGYGGRIAEFTPQFDTSPLAQVHYIITVEPGGHQHPALSALEAEIAALTRTWEDDFDDAAARADAPTPAIGAARRYRNAFPAGYRDSFSPAQALEDVAVIESLPADGAAVKVRRARGDAPDELRVRQYQRGRSTPLSEVMPILEAMGLYVRREEGFPLRPAAAEGEDDPEPVWIHEYLARAPQEACGPEGLDMAVVAPALENAFQATVDGRNENDGFNRLIITLGADWRSVCFLRACARYRGQTGMDPGPALQESALADNPAIARLLLELVDTRFNPELGLDRAAREARQEAISARITEALDAVESLDADRVLRRMARLITVIQRTNFYQRDAQGRPLDRIALKIATRELEAVPDPKPFREIFVWAPHVEGVHLRFGPIARGGLRWSDRRDDFRTEVLGLVKAQQVKNAVIVPVGAKGGFFAKRLPRGGDREAVLAEGVRAYRTFISALLDVTDNLVNDTIVRPKDVVVWDEDDAYLVVAADKGTASFSDIANEIAERAGFWLGDAFASGGSVGYDHKKMGITARGAWEAVKRHFRERGKNIQAEPFTVVGVGDMSGDVFGNGMLLSRQIRLVAAFDHRDIFIDPDPQDPPASWAERRRLFDLERSTWRDYDRSLISKGGGVFSRRAKAILLTQEIRTLTGLTGESATPEELIRALLQLPVELLWFGGIGTYVKAPHEQSFDVGDRANDGLRIDAPQVRAAVIGEGANLGLTQAARVALGRRGVRLNADFIDNAAGVDTSDHEVNIKILLNGVVRQNRMTMEERNALLAGMTEDVAAHVLTHNYDQTLGLTIAETTAAADLDAHERLIERLEGRGELDRDLERLPPSDVFRELRAQGQGLTRPETALLSAYAKNVLYTRILNSTVPDDPHFNTMLLGYFPNAVRHLAHDIRQHPLRREIVATILANQMVNVGGPTFSHRARESTGGDTDAVARAFAAAQAIFGFRDLVERIHDLDNRAPAAVQIELYRELIVLLRRQTYWLVRRGRGVERHKPRPLKDTIAAYRPGVDALRAIATDVISPFAREQSETRIAELTAAGAPEALAREVVALRPLIASSDVIDLAARHDAPLEPVARLYHACGARFHFDALRGALGKMTLEEHWGRLSARRLIEDLYTEHQRVTEAALLDGGRFDGASMPAEDYGLWAERRLEAFLTRHAEGADRLDEGFEELLGTGPWSYAKVAIAAANMREFTFMAEAAAAAPAMA